MTSDQIYVEVDLVGIVEKEWLLRIGNSCKILGLEADKPFLQLGSYSFQGRSVDTVGTSVFFEHMTCAGGEQGLKLKCHTHKKLEMQRCFLTNKNTVGEPGDQPPITEDGDLGPSNDQQLAVVDSKHEQTSNGH